MATKYWVGGTGVWTTTNSANWSDSSGGTGGANVPGYVDDVIFDGNSGGGTVTMGFDVNVKSIAMGSFVGTLSDAGRNPIIENYFSCTGTAVRTINFSGSWTIKGNNTTVWNFGVTTNLTANVSTCTLSFTYSGSIGTRTINLQQGYKNVNIVAGSDIIANASTNIVLGDFNFTGFTGTWTQSTGSFDIRGNLILGSGMTVTSGTGAITFNSTSNDMTLKSNGVAINRPVTINAGTTRTVTLLDNLDMSGASARTLTLTQGTFNANGYNVTAGSVSSANSNVRTFSMGSGTLTLTGTGNVINFSTVTNGTFNLTSSTCVVTDTSSSAKNFSIASGGGATSWGTITIVGGGTGAVVFASQNNSFTTFNVTGPKTITLNASRTYTIGSLNLNGSAGNLVTLQSSTPGTQYGLSVASGLVKGYYLSLTDCAATGGAVFKAINSTNVSNNTGWTFVNARVPASGRATISRFARASVVNMMPNGNFENAPPFTAATTGSEKWIDGTAAGSSTVSTYKFKTATSFTGTNGSAMFDSANAHAGSYGLKINMTTATGGTSGGAVSLGTAVSPTATEQRDSFIPVKPSTSYTLTFWMKTDTVSNLNAAGARMRLFAYNGTSTTSLGSSSSSYITGTTGWTQYSLTYTTPAATSWLNVWAQLDNETGTAWFDDIVLLPTSAVTTRNQLVKSQNLLVQSQDFATTWTPSNVTVSGTLDTAPDGTLTANRIVENAGLSQHVVLQNTSLSLGATYTLSVYAKTSSPNNRWLYITSGVVGVADLSYFNLSTGSIGSRGAATISSSIAPVAGASGWYRCSVTYAAYSGSTQIRFGPANADGGYSYNGDGTSYISLWGAQLVQSNQIGPYTPTTASTVDNGAMRNIVY